MTRPAGRFTAAIGLAQLWSEKPELGINFVSPKEPKEERNPRKRQKVLAGVLAAVVLLSLLGFGYTTLDGKKTMEKNMRADLKDKEDIFATLAQESRGHQCPQGLGCQQYLLDRRASTT